MKSQFDSLRGKAIWQQMTQGCGLDLKIRGSDQVDDNVGIEFRQKLPASSAGTDEIIRNLSSYGNSIKSLDVLK